MVEEAAALIHERGVAATTLEDVKAAPENVYETVALSAMKAILAELAPSSETPRYSVPIGAPASAPAGPSARLTSGPSSVPAIGTAV
jgi:hypothetical protein